MELEEEPGARENAGNCHGNCGLTVTTTVTSDDDDDSDDKSGLTHAELINSKSQSNLRLLFPS
jgi:hypothetical protein